MKSKFQSGSGCYTCGCCGQKTRDTGRDEASVELCWSCYAESGITNTHGDNHGDRGKGEEECAECKDMYDKTWWDGFRWCRGGHKG